MGCNDGGMSGRSRWGAGGCNRWGWADDYVCGKGSFGGKRRVGGVQVAKANRMLGRLLSKLGPTSVSLFALLWCDHDVLCASICVNGQLPHDAAGVLTPRGSFVTEIVSLLHTSNILIKFSTRSDRCKIAMIVFQTIYSIKVK